MNMGKLRSLAMRYAQQRSAAPTGYRGTTVRQPLPAPRQPGAGLPGMRIRPDAQLDTSQIIDRRDQVFTGPVDFGVMAPQLQALAQQFDFVKQLRNQRSTGVGVNNNGKQRRRNGRPGSTLPGTYAGLR